MEKDLIFEQKISSIPPFEFNGKVATAFDDMLERSIPFYHQIHQIINDIIGHKYIANSPIIDLGCSTGNTISSVAQHLQRQNIDRGVIIGVDNSSPMLKKCQKKLDENEITNYQLINVNIEDLELEKCGVIIMNYTLQFIPLTLRLQVMKKIYHALIPGGVLILTEKIKCKDPSLEKLQTDLYYDFKKSKGYSQLAISQKREALENILIPLTPAEQLDLLEQANFKSYTMLFKWYNFASFIAEK